MSREPLSRERIAELRALAEKATSGNWIAPGGEASRGGMREVYGPLMHVICDVRAWSDPEETRANQALIAALRNEAESLLATAERFAALEGLLRRATPYLVGALHDEVLAAMRAENGGGNG